MSTSVCWELTCDGLVSHPRGVNTTETQDKRWLHGLEKDLATYSMLKKLLQFLGLLQATVAT